MKLLNDFKSALSKGNAMSLALAVAIGGAVLEFVSRVINAVVVPVLTMITGGTDGLLSKIDTKFLQFGSLLIAIVGFAAAIAIIYAIFFIVFPMLFGKCSDDTTPPPPAPPVV